MNHFDNPRNIIIAIVVIVILIIVFIGSFKNRQFHLNKFFISIIFLFILPGLLLLFINEVRSLVHDYKTFQFIFWGMLLGIGFTYLLKRFVGFSTFEHELTHAFVALLFFNRITKFVVTRWDGGYVNYRGGLPGWLFEYLIGLAPYFLPTFVFVFVMIRPFLGSVVFPYYDIWIGMWLTFYFSTYLSEIRQSTTKTKFRLAGSNTWAQSDIAEEGYIFSFIFILAMSLLNYGIIFNVIQHDYKDFLAYLGGIFKESYFFYKSIF